MKRILNILGTGIFLFLSSCNSGDEKKAGETPIAPTTMAAASFKVIMVQHQVANFDVWKSAYMAHDSIRQASGISHFQIGRNTDDSNSLIVIDKISDVQKAKDFGSSPGLKEIMQKAGVIGAPTISYADVVRNDTSKIEYKDRVMIAHRVKDYDVWLKAYDGEGMNTRMDNGLMDRGIARGVDDPNMVYIVFAITDMAKAKARINSEALKKIMTDAGVENAPQISYYRLVD